MCTDKKISLKQTIGTQKASQSLKTPIYNAMNFIEKTRRRQLCVKTKKRTSK